MDRNDARLDRLESAHTDTNRSLGEHSVELRYITISMDELPEKIRGIVVSSLRPIETKLDALQEQCDANTGNITKLVEDVRPLSLKHLDETKSIELIKAEKIRNSSYLRSGGILALFSAGVALLAKWLLG